MSFTTVRKVGFDTETTGVDVETDRIVTASLVARGGRQPDRAMSLLIDPGVEIPDGATAIHGVTTEVAREQGVNARDGLDRVAGLLAGVLANGAVVVAFNLSYDWTILDRELRRYDLATVEERFTKLTRSGPADGRPHRSERSPHAESPKALVDPYVLDKAVHRYRRGSRRLQPMCEHYGVTGITDWHQSESDALAAVLVAERIFARYPWLYSMGPARLYESQVRWKRQQAESLQAYFRNPHKSREKYNPDAIVNGDWPLSCAPAVSNRTVASHGETVQNGAICRPQDQDNESAFRRDEEKELVLIER